VTRRTTNRCSLGVANEERQIQDARSDGQPRHRWVRALLVHETLQLAAVGRAHAVHHHQ
jgi:hypothetical protein